MSDREKVPPEPLQIIGGEIKPAAKSSTADSARSTQKSGGMTGEGGDSGDASSQQPNREGGMIGEG